MKNYWIWLLLVTIWSSKGQEIRVLNIVDETPIANVAVYNADKSSSATTDIFGRIDISIFSEDEVIIFSHVSHQLVGYTRKKILQNKGIVYLEPLTQVLDEIVVSATKFEQKKRDVAQKVIGIRQGDIQLANPQTAADLLQSSGQVFVQKSQLGGGSPIIRGFSTNRLLLSVDGVRMNNAIFRGGNLQNVIAIDPLSIQNTEVILGPGSVIYGSDAIGGAMNFFTLEPKTSQSGSLEFTGNGLVRYATASNERTAHVDVNIGLRKWAFLTSTSFTDFGDLRMGRHGPEAYLRNEYVTTINGQDTTVPNEDPLVQNPTGYNQFNFLQKAVFSPNDIWKYRFGLIYSTTSDYPRYDRLIRYGEENLRSAEWFYGPQRWFMGNTKVEKKGDGSFYDNAKLTLAFQYFRESRNDRDFDDDDLTSRKEAVDAYSANLDFEKKVRTKSSLYYGMEYILNRIRSTGDIISRSTGVSRPTSTRYPNGADWQSIAAYASYKWKPSKELALQSGLRYNFITSTSNFEANNRFFNFPFAEATINTGALTGTAGVSWSPNKTLQWKAHFSTAFRAPNIDDVGKIFDSEPGTVVVPNPNLSPEYAYSGELGLLLNFDKLDIEMATYYTFLDDALIRDDFTINGESQILYDGEISNVQAIQNAARARIYGFEAGLKYTFSEQMRMTTKFSYVGGEEQQEDGTDAPPRHAAPIFGDAHFIWENLRFKLDVFTNYNGEISFNNLAPSERNKAYLYALDKNGNPFSPSWYTLNVRGRYNFFRDFEATASLENITDQRYRPYSSGIAAAGRNLIFALRYNF
ncbi:TonB-dependent receptor plug domain-containing protein [Sungkyunkwania multivorans]|uniref:TonB-dependent receptor plug domain-containing protein n=1 Tax=Sungkyunkwania multivorans TaxID=1173618 RepID=A0ABW3D2C7_9FLAO